MVAGREREARPPLVGGRRVADVVATVVLLVVTTGVAAAAVWGIRFLSLGFRSCAAPGNSCNETLGGAVVTGGPVIVALVLVAAVATCVLRIVRRRVAWPVALSGSAVIVAVFFAAVLLAHGSVTLGI
ncbi:hypothetical protein [Curtobacterium sp. ISL-83]|uniref:hypothetical protein n=1 Tax=Curtobacterium sp. ISL-83 TaxID=2819145 RepID=UPI001BEB6B30|nr:hypothetical protein [Curtobacterium sp. ISL-83]MBT2500945.1 hypothetical protein [Curtobacterium sp. ISL-83]